MSTYDTILLMGPHGAGKGTQGKLLDALDCYVHVETGGILRRLCASEDKSPLVFEVKRILSEGAYLNDQMIASVLEHELDYLVNQGQYDPPTQFLLLDGYPRTVPQAKHLDSIASVKKVIVFDRISDDELMERILKRGAATGRAHDDESNARARLLNYREKTVPVIGHYLNNPGLVTYIDSRTSVETLHAGLVDLLSDVEHSKDL